jgi:hypothetical protein
MVKIPNIGKRTLLPLTASLLALVKTSSMAFFKSAFLITTSPLEFT